MTQSVVPPNTNTTSIYIFVDTTLDGNHTRSVEPVDDDMNLKGQVNHLDLMATKSRISTLVLINFEPSYNG